jgi:hypothetical protein
MKFPRIVCAAMKMNGNIITGIRHFSPEMRITLKRIYGSGLRFMGIWFVKPYHLRVEEQGFVDQFGNFYNRKDALIIAKGNNQVIGRIINDELYSENLY